MAFVSKLVGRASLFGAVVMAASSLVSTASAAVVLSPTLNNGSFESPLLANQAEAGGAGASWHTYNAVFTENTTGRNNLNASDGAQVIKTFGGGSGVFQDFAISPGQSYTATGQAELSASDPPGGTMLGQLLVIFFSGAGGTGSILRTDVANIVTTSSPLDQYQTGTLTNTAPAGAADLRYQLNTSNGGGGAIFFDNANLSIGAVPEPTSLTLLGLGALPLLRRRRA